MRKWIFKALTCIVSFLLAVVIIGSIMNKGNTDMTTQMSAASYPLVYINHEGMLINPLHGYSSDMDITAMRDVITPLLTVDQGKNPPLPHPVILTTEASNKTT